MNKAIKDFYEATKFDHLKEESESVPVTFTKVFYKEYPRLPSTQLPQTAEDTSQLQTLLEIRASTREFSDRPLSLEELAKVLRSCRIVDNNREPERRTYPSGGARFPVEVYAVCFNVEGLHNGAYHYNLRRETLETLWKKDLRDKMRDFISPYLDNPAVTIVLTSVLARSEVKYGPRAYPLSLIEAGHIGQNIHLTCTEIGLGSCSVSGFVDETVKEVLDLTENEIPIYTISFGKRK